MKVVVDEDSGDIRRLYLLLVAHTSNGWRLGRDWLYDWKMPILKKGGNLDGAQVQKIAHDVVGKVVGDLVKEGQAGGCVDEFLQDQLVVFQILAEGSSMVDAGKEKGKGSLHTQTVRWVAQQMLGGNVRFDEGGGCEGVGFRVGKEFGEKEGGNKKSLEEERDGIVNSAAAFAERIGNIDIRG